MQRERSRSRELDSRRRQTRVLAARAEQHAANSSSNWRQQTIACAACSLLARNGRINVANRFSSLNAKPQSPVRLAELMLQEQGGEMSWLEASDKARCCF